MGSKFSSNKHQQKCNSTISDVNNNTTRRRDLENEEEESSDDSDEADDISCSSRSQIKKTSSTILESNNNNYCSIIALPNIIIGNIFQAIDNNRDKIGLFNSCKKMRSLRHYLTFPNIDIAPPPYGRDYDYAFLDCAEKITIPLSIYNHFISTLYHLPSFQQYYQPQLDENGNGGGNNQNGNTIKLKSLIIYDFEATGIDLSTLPYFITSITLVGQFTNGNNPLGNDIVNNNPLNNSINSSNGITRQRDFIIPDHVTSLTHYYTGRGNSPLTTCYFPNVKSLTILPPPTIRDLPSSPSQSLSSSTSSTSSLNSAISTTSSSVWSIHSSFTHLCVTRNGLIPNMPLSHLTHIRFNNEFNSPIHPGLLPNSVTHLRLGERFQHHLEPGSLPSSLQWICFGNDYNSMISVGVLPESLLHVVNVLPAPGSLPSGLKSLILSPHFNNPIGREFSAQLKHLRSLDIGGFNRLLSDGMLPPFLRTLVIGRSYENRIEANVLPNTVSKIVDRSLPLANGISYPMLPNTITTLEIEHYDQTVKGAFPQSLKHLVLFLHPSNSSLLHLPNQLTHLTLKGSLKQTWTSIFPQPLKSSRDSSNGNNSEYLLPTSLTHLSLLVTTRNTRIDSLNHFPPNLTHLKFGDSFEITQIKSSSLPDSLGYLWFGKSFNLPLNGKNVLPSNLKFLRLGSEFNHPLATLPKSIETLLIDCQYCHPLPAHIPRIKFENRFDLENFTLYCGFPYRLNQLISLEENDDEFNI